MLMSQPIIRDTESDTKTTRQGFRGRSVQSQDWVTTTSKLVVAMVGQPSENVQPTQSRSRRRRKESRFPTASKLVMGMVGQNSRGRGRIRWMRMQVCVVTTSKLVVGEIQREFLAGEGQLKENDKTTKRSSS